MAHVVAILDTNIFIHFESLENIPWTHVLSADTVTLAVPHAVVEELDRLKDEADTTRKRNRARKGLKLVRQSVLGSGDVDELPDEVKLQHEEDPDDFDYDAAGLGEERKDDRIVATALTLGRSRSDEERVVLVSGDVGPQIKAGKKGVELHDLDKKYRVPSRSPEERKLQELQQQIEEYEAATPDLTVEFENSQGSYTQLEIPSSVPIDEGEIKERMQELREEYPKRTPGTPGLTEPALAGFIAPEEYERYNRQREEYFEEYEQYLRNQHHLEEFRRRSARLELEVVNSGKAPARNIEVILEIPDGPEVIADSEFPAEEFEEPAPPRPPRSSLEKMAQSMQFNVSRPTFDPGILAGIDPPSLSGQQNVGEWNIEETNSYKLGTEIGQIRQQRAESLSPFWINFPFDVEAQSFGIEYRIVADPIPGELSGKLGVNIVEPGTDDASA